MKQHVLNFILVLVIAITGVLLVEPATIYAQSEPCTVQAGEDPCSVCLGENCEKETLNHSCGMLSTENGEGQTTFIDCKRVEGEVLPGEN